jgi:hypothetical protein
MSVIYDGHKKELIYHTRDWEEHTYSIFTGEEIDLRVITMVLLLEGEITLQEAYEDLMRHDKEVLLSVVEELTG